MSVTQLNERPRRFGAAAAAVTPLCVWIATSLPPGVNAAPPLAPVQDQTSSEGEQRSSAEPTFTPGIPGIRMLDVRDYKFLWREIDQLQGWERGDRLTVAEFRGKVLEKTAHFLELRGPAVDEFTHTSSEAVASIRASFRVRRGGPENAVGAQFSSDLRAAVATVTSLLGSAPRHQLFEPECNKWLLKLAFGPSEAKETRERDLARARDR